jgi:uncharacterized protein (DUF1778 family)
MLEKAADIQGKTISSFVRECVTEAARRIAA